MLKFMFPMAIMMIMSIDTAKIILAMTVMCFNLSLQTSMTQKMTYIFMGDHISFWNLNLALWMTFIVIFMKSKNMKMYIKIMTVTLLMFTTIFFTWNFMLFFMVFEMSMIMMLLIMVYWSYQPERTEAIVFLIVMALMFSLPFLVSMLNNSKFLNFWFLKMSVSFWNYLSILLIFMMKMPTYFIHFWLPKVHVEAPVQGSMILAAIMLKLGCYGMVRVMPFMKMFKSINIVIAAMAMWAMVVLSMSCFVQIDIKTMIAYSSVVHMMLIMIIMLINKKKSLTGSIVVMMSHGLCASALFFLSNIMYTNSKSRSIVINKGACFLMPSMMFLWFCACMCNTPMPPAISLVGELIALKLILSWTTMNWMIFVMTLSSSLYSIYMFYIMVHGKFSKMTKSMVKMNVKSNLIVILHIAPALALIVKVKMLMII